ncbi:MAG: hypothetical protein JWR51_3835 [Devosia sp.]|uniref:cold shock and DUF1294 domain-containing protein n=1 Tax=Devosia sp. TaxID=1871048 RepID=UPI0026309489|nr:cold shock and DUF1294 domain-containing protein [Devosia sp.]MDB5530732.1 hypothetical protein [Devosia sp.]
MAQHGELIEWNDERGFGFIHPDGGGPRIFVHISEIARIATRPQLGDRVSYAIGRRRDGGPAAVNVSIAGANPVKGRALARGSEPAPSPKRRHAVRYYAAAILAALALAGAAIGSVPLLLLLTYSVMGIVSAAVYYDDKRQAEAGGWRTSEARLHGIDLLFGIIGGLLAQQIFRHKTAKPEFALTSGAIAALHALLLIGLISGRLSMGELANLIPG